MKGYIAALASVALVTLAQLCLKQGSVALPALTQSGQTLSRLLAPVGGYLLAGIGGYLLSAACWFLALKTLPLSQANSLLCLSYLLVPLLAPDPFPMTPTLLAGMTLVILGVLLVCVPSPPSPPNGLNGTASAASAE